MGADFHEGRVVRAGGRHGLAEPHRIAQIGHPVVGIERRRYAVGSTDRADQRDRRGHRRQIRKRAAQLGQDRSIGRMMRRDVNLDAPRQPALGVDHRDHRIDLLGRPGDHSLIR